MEEERLDLKRYWDILFRWWWILVVFVATTSLIAFFVSRSMAPVYEAEIKVLVQGGRTPGSPSLGDLQASQHLARDYRDLINTRPIMEKVIQKLSLPYTASALSRKIKTETPRSLIEITVSDLDPQLAADIANAIARIFIDDFSERQFGQIAQFQSSLSRYGITQDPAIIAAQASTLGALLIIEEALPPSSPSSPQTKLNLMMGAIVGLLIGGFVVFVLVYMDNRIKSVDELKALTGLPNFGSVLFHASKDDAGPVIVSEGRKYDPLSEAYKFLRTNLEFAAVDQQKFKTLLVTSSAPGEGKTTTASNLAIALARDGESVILVDADLRKPSIHRVFGLENQKGFSHLLVGGANLDEVSKNISDNLRVIPSGPLPPDAPQVLRSDKMKEIVAELRSKADMVIFDSPPLLSVTDPMVLASLTDGALLVLDAHKTARDTVKRGAEILNQSDLAVVGTVLNKITNKERDYYYYYYYYYGSDTDKDVGRVGGLLGIRRFLPNMLNKNNRRHRGSR